MVATLLLRLLLLVVIKLAAASFEEDCLKAHNKLRAKHSAQPLTLDGKLQKAAQSHANFMATSNIFKHSNSGYGENIYYFSTSGKKTVGGAVAVEKWLSEKSIYKFNNPESNFRAGHFSQVVWKGSKKLGCALAVKGQKFYVVASYDPAGNVMGQYSKNVSPN